MLAKQLGDAIRDALRVSSSLEPAGSSIARCERPEVLRRLEIPRHQIGGDAENRSGEEHEADNHGLVAIDHRPFDQPAIALRQPAFDILMRSGLQEIGGEHRRDQPRREEREYHLRRHRQTELLEILPRDIADETDRREDRDDGQADRDHRQTYLIGGVERRLIGRFPHPHMADDVFDFDDRIVDENAGRERDGEKAHEVQAKSRACPSPRTPG